MPLAAPVTIAAFPLRRSIPFLPITSPWSLTACPNPSRRRFGGTCAVCKTRQGPSRIRNMAARQAVLGIDRGSFHYGVTPIFENVSFLLDDARTALVGENGAGKSTLLKCLTGELELASGSVVRSRGTRIRSEERRVGKECRSRWGP